jgi:branched-chain amino acid transport system ATP-binding protein
MSLNDASPDDALSRSQAPLLQAIDLRAGYGTIPVLRGLNLAVYSGEIVALLGANGAGKTTTLHALAGEIPLRSGTVNWLGRPAKAKLHRRARAGLGLLTEERSVFMKMSVADNLRLGRGGTEAALEAMPELRNLMSRRGGLLSGGEQQMLTLARALVGDFKVLMIDEISLGLAPIVVSRLLRLVREATREQQLGVILVEQHVPAALKFSDRAVVLSRGQVVLEGPSAELAKSPDVIREVYL